MKELSLRLVKFLRRLFTALNLLPSMAMSSPPKRSHSRQKRVKERQTFWIALPKVLARVVVPSEVSYGFKVRNEAAQQPHQFNIAVSLLLQPTA